MKFIDILLEMKENYPRITKIISNIYLIVILAFFLPFLMSKFNLIEKSLILASQVALLTNIILFSLTYYDYEMKNQEVKDKSLTK